MWLKSIFGKKAISDQDEEEIEVVKRPVNPQPPAPRPQVAPVVERAQAPAAKVSTASGGNQIHFDDKLISQLKADHATLLTMYTTVANRIATDKWDTIPGALREMRTTMYGHLLTEGVKLYSYMRHNLEDEPTLMEVYRSYKKEMDGIGRVAFTFLDKYQSNEWIFSAELRGIFKSEFDNLGKVLVDRITREENILYPLYMP
ncbi:hemerythrin domain-containing protein [Glaciimonas soli]|uniref:Hemerythrin-like domain-containing protein n=1 Tax=Glaciimonas soli TaxID=2590999 RepID=A0A843YS83_9BURK|nr:hemerythrin domain-containing protein [Glaciimonas soli]MQR02425.1 hypothetical protein [Glaciimonas soli]